MDKDGKLELHKDDEGHTIVKHLFVRAVYVLHLFCLALVKKDVIIIGPVLSKISAWVCELAAHDAGYWMIEKAWLAFENFWCRIWISLSCWHVLWISGSGVNKSTYFWACILAASNLMSYSMWRAKVGLETETVIENTSIAE